MIGPGRAATLQGFTEVSELQQGMDFRDPRYRREVFLRFYGFHLEYGTHPGCVYFLLPYLAERFRWTEEEKLWAAFVNGNTQNPVTTLTILRRWPLELAQRDPEKLQNWWFHFSSRLRFDTDRRYFRTKFPEAAGHYLTSVRLYGGQRKWMEAACGGFNSWERVWRWGRSLAYFGRLSAFSYLEYLRIAGLPIVCQDLMLEDLNGSRSHRNGLCKVLGRDDLDWHDTNREFAGEGAYTPDVLAWLDHEAFTLLHESLRRYEGKPWGRDVGYFTLESALCTFKSWFRVNRRYPNCYADMLRDRILEMQRLWPGEDYEVFWAARHECLPRELRCEDVPGDPGLSPLKQNHFRLTGEVVMMDKWDPVFKNSFNDALDREAAACAV